MSAQLHPQYDKMQSVGALRRPCRLLLQQQQHRRSAVTVRSSGNNQQQSRPVFIDDSGTNAFLDWARSQGIEFPKLQPAAFQGVRGLAAKNDITADEIIVSVPRSAALSLPPKQRCPCPEFVTPAYWDAAPWFVKLGVRLLCEQRKGSASPFSQWIKQLPQQVESPVNWSQDQVQQLQYAHLIHKVTEQQQEWSGLYDKFLHEGMVNKAAAPSKQEFFHALSLVRSRTFSGPYVASTLPDRLRLAGLVGVLVVINTAVGGDLSNGLGAAAAVFLFNVIYELLLSNKLKQYAMCPVIDLINHSSYNTSEVSYDYPRDAFIVAAAAAYSPDQQVFISYGTQNNDSLMQMYGFVEQGNPYDVYVTTSLLKWLEQLQPPCQERLDALNRAGLLQALQEVVITRQGFGAETLQALRYLLVPGSSSSSGGNNSNGAAGGDSQQQQQQPELPAGAPSSYSGPADAATEQKLALVLVHVCQQELSVLGAEKQQTGAAAGAGSAVGGKGSRKAGGQGSSSNGSSVSTAVAAAAATAFRLEKRKVLLTCLEKLTGDTEGAAAAATAAAAAPAAAPAATNKSSGEEASREKTPTPSKR